MSVSAASSADERADKRVKSRVKRAARILIAVMSMTNVPYGLAQASCRAGVSGGYTVAQAAQGRTVFDAHCAVCHSANLAGGAGPALAGKNFASYLDFSKITAGQLLSFVMTQMPYNAPGSLPKEDYRAAFAYILSVNKYPAGDQPLSETNIACVRLLPYPK